MHDFRHFTISPILLYGKEEINIKSSTVSGTYSQYLVEPTEVNYISQTNEPCISEQGKVMDLWECMTDYIYSKINCTLPWTKEAEKKHMKLCSTPEEYDQYSAGIKNAFYRKSDYIENTAKCIPGCKRNEYSVKLAYSDKYSDKDSSKLDQFTLRIYFPREKFMIKNQFYIYSTSNLIADFGGYLGLLLGYSLLGFYDTLVDFFGYVRKMFK